MTEETPCDARESPKPHADTTMYQSIRTSAVANFSNSAAMPDVGGEVSAGRLTAVLRWILDIDPQLAIIDLGGLRS